MSSTSNFRSIASSRDGAAAAETGQSSSMNLPVGTPEPTEDHPPPWPADYDSRFILPELLRVAGPNGKLLPAYYKNRAWRSLNAKQMNKITVHWSKLSADKKADIFNKARHAMVNAQRARDAGLDQAAEVIRAENTTKNDLVRLMHLRVAPEMVGAWTLTETVHHHRPTLDARKSKTPLPDGKTMEEVCFFVSFFFIYTSKKNQTLISPYTIQCSLQIFVECICQSTNGWNDLAVCFNDYINFRPQNNTIQYETKQGALHPTPKVPFAAAMGYEYMATECHGLNPTDDSRSEIYRDQSWIKEKWKELKAALSTVYANFNRSGQQSGPDDAEVEWMSREEQVP